MCDANIMGGVGAVGSIAGALGGYNASRAQAQLYRQLGEAQRRAYDAAAEISDQNALITGKAAEIEASRGAASLSTLRSRGRQTISAQRAATTSLLSGVTASLFKWGDGIGAFGKAKKP